MKLKKEVAVLLTLCALMPAGIAARPHTAYAATVAGTHMAKCTAPAVPLSDAQMSFTTAGQPMDGICFVAGICSSVWPIGTLICGPTAIGCVIHYWTLK